MKRILLVGRRVAGGDGLALELTSRDFALVYATTPADAYRALSADAQDLLLIEHQPSDADLAELVRGFRNACAIPIVIVSSCGSIADCESAMRAGADRFLAFRRGGLGLARVCQELIEGADARHPSDRPLTAREARVLGENELKHRLERLIVECRGNVAEVARRMGRDRSTIRYHLRRLGLLDSDL